MKHIKTIKPTCVLLMSTLMSSSIFAQGAPQPPAVGVIVMKPQTVVMTENLPARLEASREAVIMPQVGGIVQKRLFSEGSVVTAGQQLYQIDDAIYQANLLAAQAQLAQAQANRALADSTAKRYAPLVKEKAVSRQTYDQAVAQVKVADANIATANAAIKQAKINVEYAKVKAPIAGVIGRSKVSEGALVGAGAVEMATIQQLDPIYLNITQSASQMLRMREEFKKNNMDNSLRITFDDGTVYPHTAKFLFAEHTVNATTGDVLLRAEVANPDGILLTGLYVRADVPQRQIKDAFLVPQSAVTRGKTDTLRVVAGDGSFAPREVKIAGSRHNQFIVTEGLKEGEMVMVDSLSQLMMSATHVTPIVLDENGKPKNSPTATQSKSL